MSQRATLRTAALALASGAAGAAALTAVHQAARARVPRAPRMDLLGMRALEKGVRALGHRPPTGRRLYRSTLAGDLVGNSVYYAMVGASDAPVRTGLALGIAAGVGALVLPPLLGLGTAPHSDARSNQVMTVAWYVLGGLVAGAVQRAFSGPPRPLRVA